MTFMMYMRSELYKISNIGGALVTPLFAAFPEHSDIYTPDILDSVMYGDAIKVDFVFEKDLKVKNVLLHGSWLNLNSFE
jgi:alpha-glucosidase (family GH31 glycosyl hydrolase)